MTYYHRSIFDLYIAPSQISGSGLGVYTRCHIPNNSYIDDYYGQLVEYICPGEYSFQISDTIYINAESHPRCYMAMLNDASYVPRSKRALRRYQQHGFVNNCRFVTDTVMNRIRVYSMMDILPDSELFVAYGDDYWN